MNAPLLILIGLLLINCHPDKNRPLDLDNVRMKTSDGSELFFKNVRQSHYNIEEVPEAGIYIYDLKRDDTQPLTNKIIHNWRMDLAYLQIIVADSLIRELYFEEEGLISKMELKELNFNDQTRSSLLLYNLILENKRLFLNEQQTDTLVFDRESFRITVFDFLRLTDNR